MLQLREWLDEQGLAIRSDRPWDKMTLTGTVTVWCSRCQADFEMVLPEAAWEKEER